MFNKIVTIVLTTLLIFTTVGSIGTEAATFTSTKKIEVRKGATSSYPIVTYIEGNQNVSVIDEFVNTLGEKWYRVDLGAVKGWSLASAFTENTDTKNLVGSYATVTYSPVNIRSGATTAYKVVTQANEGDVFKVIDSFKNATSEIWYRVEFEGIKGWIDSTYVKESSTNVGNETTIDGSSYVNSTQKLKASSANMRSGATTSYRAVALIPGGTSFKILNSFTNASKEVWFQVSYNGKKGWVLSDLFDLAKIQPPLTTKKVITQQTIHSGATKTYKVVATATIGSTLPIYAEFTNSSKEKWYNVGYAPGKKGWIIQNAFEAVDSTPPQPGIINEKNRLIINVTVANLRSGPSLDNEIVTRGSLGEVFESTGYVVDADGDKWYTFTLSDGKKVWAHYSVVKIENVTPPPAANLANAIQTYNATVYTTPSFASSAVATPIRGTGVTRLGPTAQASDLTWYDIRLANGARGWVPEFELTSNLVNKYGGQTQKVFSGASSSYSAIDTIWAGSPVTVLLTLSSGWVNIETSSHKRGWVPGSSLTTVSPMQLINPREETRSGERYLVWSKKSNFDISYTLPARGVLAIKGNISYIENLNRAVTGVKSMNVSKDGNGMATLTINFDTDYSYSIREYSNEITIKIIPKGLQGKTIIIDAGHGAHDPGAKGPNGNLEKNINLATSLAVQQELESAGAKVIMTRTTDVFLELSERTYIANNSNADAFISIHSDSFTSTSKGSTSYYNTTVNFNGPLSYTLAKNLQAELITAVGTYNRGVKEQLFYVNRMNELPSVLIELGFISNPTEEALLASDAFKKNAAVGIRKGLENYFTIGY